MARHNTLLLFPTQLETRCAQTLIEQAESAGWVALCGFGPVVAAARTAHLLTSLKPSSVMLVGIAGSLDAQLKIGCAYEFSEVACYGIGAGSGSQHQTVAELGWSQWPKEPTIVEKLDLTVRDGAVGGKVRQLLSVCAAAGCRQDVSDRRQKFPAALAEDMEGFAVACACRLANVPLTIVRGISNVAGDRDHRHWKISEAMQAAECLALQIWET